MEKEKSSIITQDDTTIHPSHVGQPSPRTDFFASSPADIDFAELIKLSKSPVVDLRPLRHACVKSDKPERLFANIMTVFGSNAEIFDKIIFIGDRSDVENIFLSAPQAKDALLRNPSIVEILNATTSE